MSTESPREPSAPTDPDSAPQLGARPGRSRARPEPRCVSSATLLGSDGLLIIDHNGERYTLRRTRAGRLILTK